MKNDTHIHHTPTHTHKPVPVLQPVTFPPELLDNMIGTSTSTSTVAAASQSSYWSPPVAMEDSKLLLDKWPDWPAAMEDSTLLLDNYPDWPAALEDSTLLLDNWPDWPVAMEDSTLLLDNWPDWPAAMEDSALLLDNCPTGRRRCCLIRLPVTSSQMQVTFPTHRLQHIPAGSFFVGINYIVQLMQEGEQDPQVVYKFQHHRSPPSVSMVSAPLGSPRLKKWPTIRGR